MEARFITDRQQWDDFVSQSPYGNITQSFDWGELVKDVGSIPLHIGVVDEQGELNAAVLVLVNKVPLLRAPYFYVPRGPIIADPTSPAFTVLLNFLKSEAHKRGVFMLKVEPGVEDSDTTWKSELTRRGFHAVEHANHIRNEWILDLRPTEKELLANMKEKWRYNIRLAGRKGVTIRRGHGKEDITTFHRILQETSVRDNFFIHGVEHYELMMRLYEQGDRIALFLAEHEGRAIAGNITMCYGHWSWYRYGASSSQLRNVMPNHLLQWTAMQWARSRDCWFYNFLGIPENLDEQEARKDPLWGVYTFKRGFNGFARLSIPGYDLPYNPFVYTLYKRLLDIKHWRDNRQLEKEFATREREQQAEQKQSSPPEQQKRELQATQAL